MKVVNTQNSRYSKQVLFKPIGEQGQKLVAQKRVVIAGCGALGSVIANTLVRAGVGEVRIVDRDFVEMSNLQRQILFDENDVKNDLPKAVAATNRLKQINSTVKIEPVISDINHSNVEDLTKDADLVIDGLDNFETRFLINDCCVKNKIPWIYGACVGSEGLSMNIVPDLTPCLRCVFETEPLSGTSPTCDTSGVIAPIVNIIGSIQSCEALKILSGNVDASNKKLISIDVWNDRYNEIGIENARESTDCQVCKHGRYDYLTAKVSSTTTTLCGRNSVQIQNRGIKKMNLNDTFQRLKGIGDVKLNDFLLKLKIDKYEITLFDDGRAIILGTDDPVVAKNVYTKYIGM